MKERKVRPDIIYKTQLYAVTAAVWTMNGRCRKWMTCWMGRSETGDPEWVTSLMQAQLFETMAQADEAFSEQAKILTDEKRYHIKKHTLFISLIAPQPVALLTSWRAM